MDKSEEKNKKNIDDILSVYRELGVKLEDFPENFDPSVLGQQLKNFTIYQYRDFTFSSSSSTQDPL